MVGFMKKCNQVTEMIMSCFAVGLGLPKGFFKEVNPHTHKLTNETTKEQMQTCCADSNVVIRTIALTHASTSTAAAPQLDFKKMLLYSRSLLGPLQAVSKP